jgi:nucleotide-binding universal stress UspA family protein
MKPAGKELAGVTGMVNLKNILVTTDFAACSNRAVCEACGLAAAVKARLHLLHVVVAPFEQSWAGYEPASALLDDVEKREKVARRHMRALASSSGLKGDRVAIATFVGDPVESILEYARLHDIDLIVCGTHGRRGIERYIMGSVAERLVQLAHCPVLTVSDVRTKAFAAA